MINIFCWDKKIAIASQMSNMFYVELANEEYRSFSPLLFEHGIQAKTKVKEIDEIGIIADVVTGSYGKMFFEKYFVNEFGSAPTLLDRLSFIGSRGVGALEFRAEDEKDYKSGIQETIALDLGEFTKQTLSVFKGDYSSGIAKLIAKSNSGAGGAKAKAVIDYDATLKKVYVTESNNKKLNGFQKCIIKFNSEFDEPKRAQYNDELKLEYIYYLLAKECGIKMSPCWLETDSNENSYFITKRFDVNDEGERYHLHSLAGILSHDASSFTVGYESLFRVGKMLSVSVDDMEQIFRTMVFNIVFANRDDHSRNFSFLMDRDYIWSYAPSYDLTYSGTNVGLSNNQLTVGGMFVTQVKELTLKKIAQTYKIKQPLEIIDQMVDIKHSLLRGICDIYNIDKRTVEQIFQDTQEIDKRFSRR